MNATLGESTKLTPGTPAKARTQATANRQQQGYKQHQGCKQQKVHKQQHGRQKCRHTIKPRYSKNMDISMVNSNSKNSARSLTTVQTPEKEKGCRQQQKQQQQ
jgi:hypothetical protein